MDLSDEALLERYRENPEAPGREQWINELFSRHHRKVALWCLRMTSDRENALDLAQEVFAKAYAKLDTFRGDSRFSTWLYTIARFHCLNHVRASASRPDHAGEDSLSGVEDSHIRERMEGIEHQIDCREIWRAIRTALTETERRVMMLHYAHEMPLKTVATLLELNNSSGAKAYIVSARRKLGPALKRWQSRTAGVKATVSGLDGGQGND